MKRLALIVLLFSSLLHAESPFAAADRLVDGEQFAPALKAFAAIRQAHPDWNWPREQRHLEAYAHFRAEDLAGAEERWGALLCESHTDPLSFRIAYNLALAQERLGETDRAYWTLLLVPGETVLKQPAGSQQAYFELASIVAAKQKKFAVAAQVALTASQVLRDRAARRHALFRVKEAAARITNIDEWQALLARVGDPALRADLEAHRPPAMKAASAKPAAPANQEAKISGLRLAAYRVHEVPVVGAAQPVKRLVVLGRYEAFGRFLICGGAPVNRDRKGRFKLDLEIVNGTASPFLLSLGGAEAEQQAEEYFMADWSQFHPNIDADLAEDDSEAPASGGSGMSWRQAALQARGTFQQSGGTRSFFPEAQWAPAYSLGGNWYLQGEIGFFLSRKVLGGNFVGLDDNLLLGYLWRNSVRLELGGGAQTWLGYGGTYPQVGGELGLELGVPFLHLAQIQTLLFGGNLILEPRHTRSLSGSLRFSF